MTSPSSSSPGPSSHHHHCHKKPGALLSSQQFHFISLSHTPCEVSTIFIFTDQLSNRGIRRQVTQDMKRLPTTAPGQPGSVLSVASHKTSWCRSHLFDLLKSFGTQHWPVPVLRPNICSDFRQICQSRCALHHRLGLLFLPSIHLFLPSFIHGKGQVTGL